MTHLLDDNATAVDQNNIDNVFEKLKLSMRDVKETFRDWKLSSLQHLRERA